MLTHKTWQINNRAFFVPVFFACIFQLEIGRASCRERV